MAGVNNRVYTDWLTSMFKEYQDIDEVFLCIAPLNRFTIGFDNELSDDVISVDHFKLKCDSSNPLVSRYVDNTVVDDKLQLFNKPTYDDYSKFPGINLSAEKGLLEPDLRKHTYMQVKLFFELNSFLEKKDLGLQIFAWDRLCFENNAKLYIFNFTERLKFPEVYNYYGKLKATTVAPKTVEKFFADKNIDHTKYFIEDNEHYNKDYHDLIATKYLPWLKTL
jgi:hypothetical protein